MCACMLTLVCACGMCACGVCVHTHVCIHLVLSIKFCGA